MKAIRPFSGLLPVFCTLFAAFSLYAHSPRTNGSIEITTSHQQSHKGHLLAVTPASVLLLPPKSNAAARLGIPRDQIQQLRFTPAAEFPAGRLNQWNSLQPLLHRLHPDSANHLLADLQALLHQNGKARTVFHWAESVATRSPLPSTRHKATLTAAEALAHLRLWEPLRQRLPDLNKAFPPLKAPPVLCALNAQIALRDRQTDQAVYWATVPDLQIPLPKGNHADQLRKLAAFLRQSPDQPIPDHLNLFQP